MTDETTTFEITTIDARADGVVAFTLRNHGEPQRILESWLPHGEFHSDRKTYDPPLSWDEVLTLEHATRWSGGEVANAFLILRLDDTRLFFRLRPTPDGIVVEKTTTGTA